MTIKKLFDEYRQLSILNSGSSDEAYEMYSTRKERMAEIISEIETLIRKETIEEILKLGEINGGIYSSTWEDKIEDYALSKGIKLD